MFMQSRIVQLPLFEERRWSFFSGRIAHTFSPASAIIDASATAALAVHTALTAA
jgi:hypothetical protein